MKILILGTRGEIKESTPYHSKHSGVLIDKKLLFDLGEPEFLNQKPKAVFLTHLHPDHAYFLRSQNKDPKSSASFFAPEKYEGELPVKVMNKAVNEGHYKITPIPTHHSIKVKSQAYLIEKGRQKILYTGDLIWINKKYHKKLRNLDLVITEASFIKKGGMIKREKKSGEMYGHNGAPELINLCKKFSKNIVLMHFGSWFYKDVKAARNKIKDLAQVNDVNITVAYDGLEATVKQFQK